MDNCRITAQSCGILIFKPSEFLLLYDVWCNIMYIMEKNLIFYTMHVIINTNKNFWGAIIMKCTFCGNENIVKTYFPIISYGDGGADISKEVDVYFCLDCGHYDFFSKTKVNRYYETITWINDTEKKIENLHLKLVELQNPMVEQKVKDKIQRVETKLKSVDITIR